MKRRLTLNKTTIRLLAGAELTDVHAAVAPQPSDLCMTSRGLCPATVWVGACGGTTTCTTGYD